MVVLTGMTVHDPMLSRRRNGFWPWFGRSANADEAPPGDDVADGSSGSGSVPLGVAPDRLIGAIGAFLAQHDLETTAYTLTVAHDCLTGECPRLMRLIEERATKGLPVTIAWLEHAAREAGHNREAERLTALMARLEDSIEEFGKTATTARSATLDYNSALSQHVDDLEQVSKAGTVITELATLARAMLDRTRSIEGELARSEKRAQTLQKNLTEARRMADHDHLTGLPNRRAFDKLLDEQYRDARAANEPLCVAFCDVDRFKLINDTHGHPAGDRVLKAVAEMLARISGDQCHVARHGGEEFAVLFRATSIGDAFERLEGAREDIANRRLVNRANDSPFGQITFSAGLAEVLSYSDKREALKAADDALLRAKAQGRNRIVRADAAGVASSQA
ncbi:GGDEF domain-containing protein [Novosphingobium lentum]|uniref:GGDEF domain-containing protein n=1 Tax=Novosphingobium lentum TaxID=145287 RepID=UPI000B2E95C2|nr:GGDEF domain-containing protein [Novosphingobium lentum]